MGSLWLDQKQPQTVGKTNFGLAVEGVIIDRHDSDLSSGLLAGDKNVNQDNSCHFKDRDGG